LAFALGILLGHKIEIPSIVFILSLVPILSILIITNQRFNYKRSSIFGFFTHLLFILLGIAVFEVHNTKPFFHKTGMAIGTILETPQEKPNSFKSLILLNKLNSEDSCYYTNEKVLAYFEKEEKARNLEAGMQIIINNIPSEVKNNGNPYEFDYKNYLNHKSIYRQVYLSSNKWKSTNKKTKTLVIWAEQLREQLLDIYHNQNLGFNETEILSALTLGYKRDLDPETKRVFSAAGAMHVLAVSGLHVGIIYLVFSYVFGFLRKQKTGRFIFTCTSITLLWTYAFITGLSPSVLRASTMFTIVIIGQSNNRRASIYNSLAASAVFLLLLNPNNLFDVGFQLSYSAVFGIVYLQPRFEKLWLIKNKVLKFFWSLFCVSLAAQIATFPLTAFYFNQFPTFFWLSNIVVIPVVIVLIPLGITLLIVSKVHFLSVAVAFFIKWLIAGVYFLLQFIESLPFSTIDISLSPVDLVLFIFFLFSVFIFLKSPQVTYLKLALSFVLLLSGSIFYANFLQQQKHEIIVFNASSNLTTQIITGRKSYIISKQKITNDDFIQRQIQDVKRNKRLYKPIYIQQTDSFEDDFIFLKNGLLYFQNKTICFESTCKNLPADFSPDYLITEQNPKKVNCTFRDSTIIISNNYSRIINSNHQIHSLKTEGAFYERIN
jgi:competence protein ComEC